MVEAKDCDESVESENVCVLVWVCDSKSIY